MKHVYATLIFCSVISGNLFAQCTGVLASVSFQSDGRGNYTFDTMNIQSPDVVCTFYLSDTLNTVTTTLLVDSNTFHTSYSFDTNGRYSICIYARDTIAQCSSLVCHTIIVEDAEYHKLLEEVNEWGMTTYKCFARKEPTVITSRSSCSDYSNSFFTRIYSEGDTVIDAVNYKKIFSGGDVYYNVTCELGYIREDTIFRKVYFRDDEDTTESILYDFSMKVGDSIFLRFKPTSLAYYNSGTYTLLSISSVSVISGKYRVFSLRSPNSSYPLFWLEGTGHLGHPTYTHATYGPSCGGGLCYEGLYYQISPPYFGTEVLCFSHQNKVYFNDCSYQEAVKIWSNCFRFVDSCDYGLICGAVNEISSLKSLNISPNPTDGKITLQFDVAESSEFEVLLYSLDGRKMIGDSSLGRLTAGLQSRSMNLENLPSGFYLLECRNKEGSMFKKVVIER